jgi:hypothetical protein
VSGPAVLAVIAALAPPVPLHLTVRYDPGAGGQAQVARLVCGTHPSATGFLRAVGTRRACARARQRAPVLLHVPDETQRACDQIYGGPDTARVTGRIGTELVHRRFSRTDGCRTAEWDSLVPLLPSHMFGG